jgi:hypothetical protein|tara:strand:+ start:1313 stop:1465 length:153 start_codon:yes stop_codon:yes gene_type:complete
LALATDGTALEIVPIQIRFHVTTTQGHGVIAVPAADFDARRIGIKKSAVV